MCLDSLEVKNEGEEEVDVPRYILSGESAVKMGSYKRGSQEQVRPEEVGVAMRSVYQPRRSVAVGLPVLRGL